MTSATAEWSGIYNHSVIAGIWFRGSFDSDEYLVAPPVDSYDYQILVTGTETVWVLPRTDTYAVGLTVRIHPSLPPRPNPTRPLAQVHPLEASTARVYNQTGTVQFTEPGELWVGATIPITEMDLPRPSPFTDLLIPPDAYNVRASLWHYAHDGGPDANLDDVIAIDDVTNVDQFPVQIHVQFWPRRTK